MTNPSPKLSLTADERQRLRESGITLREEADCDAPIGRRFGYLTGESPEAWSFR